jgi:hypothetical protein
LVPREPVTAGGGLRHWAAVPLLEMNHELRKENPPIKTDFSREAVRHRMILRARRHFGMAHSFFTQGGTQPIKRDRQLPLLALLLFLPFSFVQAATISGLVITPEGTPYTSIISFFPLSNPQIEGGAVITRRTITLTATNGVFSVNLEQGNYRVVADGQNAILISVPNDGGTYNLQHLAVNNLTYVYQQPPASSATLANLSDVLNVHEAVDGQALAFDAGTQKWKPGTLIAGGNPGGLSTEMQFRNGAAVFGGATNFLYDLSFGLAKLGVEKDLLFPSQAEPFSIGVKSATFTGVRDDMLIIAYNQHPTNRATTYQRYPGNTNGWIRLDFENKLNAVTYHQMEHNLDFGFTDTNITWRVMQVFVPYTNAASPQGPYVWFSADTFAVTAPTYPYTLDRLVVDANGVRVRNMGLAGSSIMSFPNDRYLYWLDAAGGQTNQSFIWMDSSDRLRIGSGNTTRAVWAKWGFLGLGGELTPSYTVDLAGDLRIQNSGFLHFGGTGTNSADVSVYLSAPNVLTLTNGDLQIANLTPSLPVVTDGSRILTSSRISTNMISTNGAAANQVLGFNGTSVGWQTGAGGGAGAGNGMVLSGTNLHFGQTGPYTPGLIPYASSSSAMGFATNVFYDLSTGNLTLGTPTAAGPSRLTIGGASGQADGLYIGSGTRGNGNNLQLYQTNEDSYLSFGKSSGSPALHLYDNFLQVDYFRARGGILELNGNVRPLTVGPNVRILGTDGNTNLVGITLIESDLPSITNRAKLPSAIAYEDEANIFSGVNALTNLGNTISGNGGGLTNLNGSNIASGTVPDARLSGNVSLLGPSISEGELALTDVTTANATTSAHGLMPKGDGNTNHFYNGANAQTGIPLTAIQTNGAGALQVICFNGTNWVVCNDQTGGAGSAFVDGASVSNPNFKSNSNLVYSVTEGTNITAVVTNVSSSQIVDGTIVDADVAASGITTRSKLPAAIAYEDEANTFSGINALTNLGNTISGNGAGLTNLNGSNIASGTVARARLPAEIAYEDEANTFSGINALTNLGNTISGNGAGLTNLNASNLASGTVARARLPAELAYEDEANTFSGIQTITNASQRLAWLDLGSGTNINYAASTRFYRLITETNITWTTSNETDGTVFRLMMELATNIYSTVWPTNWMWSETGTTNPPATTVAIGAISEIEVERRNGTNYARLVKDPNVPLRVNLPVGALVVSQGSGQPVAGSVTMQTNVVLGGGGADGIPEWRQIFDYDLNALGITTRSKLPSALAYEDEPNTFSLAQTFTGPVSFSPVHNTTTLNWSSGPSYDFSTNASFGITFSGSPVAGAFLDYFVTNTATTNIVVTNLSVQAYSMEDQSLVDGVTIPGNTNVTRLFWRYTGLYYQLSVQTKANATLKKIGTTGATDMAVNGQTGTSYTVLQTDKGDLVTLTNASAITVTLPQATNDFGSGFWVSFQNMGAGTATLTPTTSKIDGATTLALTQNQGVIVASDGTNYFTMRGAATATAAAAAPALSDYFITNKLEMVQATGTIVSQVGINSTSSGDLTVTQNATSQNVETATTPPNVQYDGATATNATGVAGIEGTLTKDFGRPYDLRVTLKISQTNTTRFFCGISTAVLGVVTNNNFAGDYAGFYIDPQFRRDTNWWVYSKDGTTTATNDTGVHLDANWHQFRILANSSSNVFYIDGTAVLTNSSNLPRSGQKGAWVVKVHNYTNTTARSIFINKLVYTSPTWP